MSDLASQRRYEMVERQVARRGVSDAHVLAAMRKVPRECFLPDSLEGFAYEDSPLPIEDGQTISQPYIVALMIASAAIRPGNCVLEVGAGSGYAAAIMASIAERVYTIERHAGLADSAKERLWRLGYRNVEVRCSDGTLGWPEAAPFDAILVAAGGPEAPDILKRQLKIGGCLVMPIGDEARHQFLVKITRTAEDAFEEEKLASVHFVPLIGELGWAPDERTLGAGLAGAGNIAKPATLPKSGLAAQIAEAAEPLPDIDDPNFGAFFDRFAHARVVLLGEASHGTSEFYRARNSITRHLIEAHGFSIVAVEADWPDAASMNRYVQGEPELLGAESPFQRFPTWMWRNTDADAFIRWLRCYNALPTKTHPAGFYGLDLYNLNGSMRAVIDYLERVDPAAAQVARERYGCLMPWGTSPQSYGRMAKNTGFALCKEAVVSMLSDLNAKRMQYAAHDGERFLDAAANARLVKNAEVYYRAMYEGRAESWNIRDRHMFDTLCQLLEAKGPKSKAVVWAHNSHIGDARYTDMGEVREQLNIGQLCRERFGDEAALIGFGTHTGTVACADDWDKPMQVKRVNPSRPDSYEYLAHESGVGRFLLDLREGEHDDLRQRLLEPRLERFIGVIYRPDTERWSHYSACQLPRQFDAYVWFDKTTAVAPLATLQKVGPEETYPFGV